MLDQLIISGKASYDDFGASVADRKLPPPKKKSIKETVPHSNVTYDFSKIGGEVFWEERELEYAFEIIAPTPEALEEMITEFSAWVMNVTEEEIHDPFIPEYHFIGTYADMKSTYDESMEKVTLSVTFTAYPYKIANVPKGYDFTIPAYQSKTVYVENKSAHKIAPEVTASGSVSVRVGNVSVLFPKGSFTVSSLKLEQGVNAITLSNSTGTECDVTIKFSEEVF